MSSVKGLYFNALEKFKLAQFKLTEAKTKFEQAPEEKKIVARQNFVLAQSIFSIAQQKLNEATEKQNINKEICVA